MTKTQPKTSTFEIVKDPIGHSKCSAQLIRLQNLRQPPAPSIVFGISKPLDEAHFSPSQNTPGGVTTERGPPF